METQSTETIITAIRLVVYALIVILWLLKIIFPAEGKNVTLVALCWLTLSVWSWVVALLAGIIVGIFYLYVPNKPALKTVFTGWMAWAIGGIFGWVVSLIVLGIAKVII